MITSKLKMLNVYPKIPVRFLLNEKDNVFMFNFLPALHLSQKLRQFRVVSPFPRNQGVPRKVFKA